MADFAIAIAVSPASPIQPVATSKDDTELASRPLISSELGASKISRWYPPRPASIAHRALCHALIWRVRPGDHRCYRPIRRSRVGQSGVFPKQALQHWLLAGRQGPGYARIRKGRQGDGLARCAGRRRLLTPSFLVAIGFFSPKRVGWGADNLFIAFDHAGCRLTSGRTARPLA